MFILNFLFVVVILAALAILPEDLIALLMPVVVWLATGFVNWLKATLGNSGFGGTVLTTLIVPAFSLILSWFGTLISPDLNFWLLFILGLLSVFVNEVIKQWKQTLDGEQTKAKKEIIG